MDYVTALHWRQRACREAPAWGTWWRLAPGEALFFNNWRAHSDTGFGTGGGRRGMFFEERLV